MMADKAGGDLHELAERIDRLWDGDALRDATMTAEARLAAAPEDRSALWIAGLANHNLAVDGNRGAAAKAEASLRRLVSNEPQNALAFAYLGNAIIMVARDSRNVMTKAATVKKGLDLLDQAVRLDPDHVSIRLLRAGSGRRLPKLFGRKPVAKADLAHAIALLESGSPPRPHQLAETCYDLAMLMDGHTEAEERRALLLKTMEADPTSESAANARESLNIAA